MGSMCQQPIKQKDVTSLSNSISQDRKYKIYDSQSIRFNDISAYKSQRNQYLFTMSIRNEIDIRQCITVLNQMIHCISCENYQIKLQSKAIIDIFDPSFQSSLIESINQKTRIQYSMKIIPFTSYTSYRFKKAFYELYLNNQLRNKAVHTVQLLDYYIYGLNPNQQAFVLLFQKCSTSLANVAQYRKQAFIPWTDKQKIKIIYQIFQSYESIYNKNIVHRDIRPSNVFYVPSSGRFLIGNFSRARLLRRNLQQNQLMMSVCGVPQFSCLQMEHLMKAGQHIGYYQGIKQDYYGLRSILNIIQTCEIYDRKPIFKDSKIAEIDKMLTSNIDFRKIMVFVNNLLTEKSINKYAQIRDRQIADKCSFLLAHTHKQLIQNFLFKAYGDLGHSQKYSDKAHNILTKNSQNGKQQQNAPILSKLGDFYEAKGAKGTEYYYNAFILYISRADNQIRYGYPDRAQSELNSAQQVYFKFNRVIQSDLPRIQINITSALIQLQNRNIQQAKKIINQTFFKAAKSNIPVQKQCKLLLAYGKIFMSERQTRDEALKKLETGLTICQNPNNFESPSVCRIKKSKFLRQIGIIYLLKYQAIHYPKLNQPASQQQITLKAQAQTNLRQALQIQQTQTVDDLQIADTLQQLARLYYIQQNVYDAKIKYQQTKIRLAHFKQLVNPRRQILVIYMKGSCNYYLKQYSEAKTSYEICLAMLQHLPKTSQNQILTYNISGNLGLSFIKLGNPQGEQIVKNALANIQQMKGDNSYDYVSLFQNHSVVYNT